MKRPVVLTMISDGEVWRWMNSRVVRGKNPGKYADLNAVSTNVVRMADLAVASIRLILRSRVTGLLPKQYFLSRLILQSCLQRRELWRSRAHSQSCGRIA